ncbi:MAG: flagellar hook-associated protein FlgK [Lachnospiraceae bacterium]|nr:flagellar hook-associated protein FlgK [Lachnospiraceae bacterium]
MPSQFFGLNIAYTGLLASNAALNTTSNNIANVQTEGYSRQQVKQQASNALRVFQTYGCAGAGVETLAIERVRDEFYDGKFWDNNAKVGEYDMKQYYMEQLETYFDDNGKNAGFKTVFDQMMVGGLQELLKSPGDETKKSQFVGYAGNLTEYFNGLAGNLEAMQKDINQEIKLKVDEINSLAGEIATLNKQINTIELSGAKANELRDRRTLLLDQLSEIVDIETKEIPITDANNPERETGGNRFLVKIAGGQLLVDTNEYRGLECVARKNYEKVNQTDFDGLYDVYWEDGQQFNLYNAAMGGNLRGLIELRDGNNGENFTGLITDVGTANIGGETHDTVTIEVGKAYLQDLNKCNLSDQGGIINLGNQEFYYDSWQYTCSYDDAGNATYSYTFILSSQDKNDMHVTNDRMGKTATVGAGINYQGIPYYMSQMNEWVRSVNFCAVR